MIVVAVVFLALAAWASHHDRRDVRVQLITATATIASQYSIAVAVLTSSETLVAWRIVAAVIYVALPFAAALASK